LTNFKNLKAMNKLILLIFSFSLLTFDFSLLKEAEAQSLDTTNWSLKKNQAEGLYTQIQNRTVFYSKPAGTVIVPLIYNASLVDTSKFQLIRSQTDGTYRQALNKITWYGKSPGTVKINLSYDVNTLDTTGLASRSYVNAIIDTLPKLSENNIWTGGQEYRSFLKFHSRTMGDGDTILVTDVIIYHAGATNIFLCNPAVFVNRFAIVKNTGADAWTLNPYASETIDGQSSLTFLDHESYILTSDGNNWFILSKK